VSYLGSLERILITLVSLSSFPGLSNRFSGDSGMNIKSAEIVLGGPEQVDECLVASTCIFDRLDDLDIRRYADGIGERDIWQAGW
jgi:hypothetical protein